MLRRALSLLVLVWALGFLAFAVTLPQPLADDAGSHSAGSREAAVVLTGGEGRIDRGLALLRSHRAGRLFVSGVDPEVKPAEFAAQYHVEPRLMRCCVTLGYEAVDTRSNARETADWAAKANIASLRLVTSDWHMRRAAWELRQALPSGVALIEDAVPGHPSFNTLFTEYHKYIARRLWRARRK